MTSSHRCLGSGRTIAAVNCAFSSVLRDLSSTMMRAGSTPSFMRSSRAAGASFELPDQRAASAGEHHSGLRVALGEKRRFDYSLALIEDDLAPRLADEAVDRTPQNDDPEGRRDVGRRLWKAVLQGCGGHQAKWRHRDGDEDEDRCDPD